jgi:5'-nucleotidase
MRLLLTNDDGFDAPGLAALERALGDAGELWVVAPASEQSGVSHRVTTEEPVAHRGAGERRYIVEGTPADCVRLALHGLVPPPTAVVAGINCGGNLGVDVFHSGTVAAAREAAIHGLPAIAVSHFWRRELAIRWEEASRWVAPVLQELLLEPPGRGRLWSVNLPHLDPGSPPPEVGRCALDLSPLPLVYRAESRGLRYAGIYREREHMPGGDVATCFGGRIAVTLVAGS